MTKGFLGLLAVCLMSTVAQASLHTYVCIDVPSGGNPFTVVGSGAFELSDTPNMTGFQFPAVSPFTVEVVGHSVGNVQFDLIRGATLMDSAVLVFENATHGLLRMQFDVPGLVSGDAFPAAVGAGEVEWVAENLAAPSQPSKTLAGIKTGEIAAVPEPSAFAFGALAIGLVGLGRKFRNRFNSDEE